MRCALRSDLVPVPPLPVVEHTRASCSLLPTSPLLALIPLLPTPQVSVTDSVFDLRKAFQEAERLGEAQARKEIQRSMASRDDDGGEQAGKK